MKIAITFKYNADNYKLVLEKRGFNIGNSSNLKTLWVYDLKYIYTNFNNELVLEDRRIEHYKIDLKDIDYYEIHSEN